MDYHGRGSSRGSQELSRRSMEHLGSEDGFTVIENKGMKEIFRSYSRYEGVFFVFFRLN